MDSSQLTSTNVVNTLAMSVVGGAYLLMFCLMLIVWNRIEKTRKELGHKLEKAMKDINALADKNKKAIDLADERLDVLDRVSSNSTDHDFSSKLVASGQQPFPTSRKIKHILGTDDPKAKGNA